MALFPVQLVESRAVTSRVKSLVFERVDQQPFRHTSGHWVSLELPLLDEKGRKIHRVYSIASVPALTPRFELVITRVEGGRGSPYLHDLPVGSVLEAKGPSGVFTRTLDTPSLFVATGTGMAPFRGMLSDSVAAGWTSPLWILLGVRTEEEVLFKDELAALTRDHSHIHLEVTLSRPSPSWTGRRGYVQAHVAELWSRVQPSDKAHAYVCGADQMIHEVRDVLRTQLNVERVRVHAESYG